MTRTMVNQSVDSVIGAVIRVPQTRVSRVSLALGVQRRLLDVPLQFVGILEINNLVVSTWIIDPQYKNSRMHLTLKHLPKTPPHTQVSQKAPLLKDYELFDNSPNTKRCPTFTKKQTLPMRKQTARYWFGDLEFLYHCREWYDGENEY